MIINVYFENGGDRWCHVSVYQKLLKKLTESNPKIQFNYTDSIFKRTTGNYSGPACKFGPHFMILENEKNKKYFRKTLGKGLRFTTKHLQCRIHHRWCN